jgi:hypothetical protein
MRERAMLVGAQLTITRPPSGGTEVRLSIPLAREPNDRFTRDPRRTSTWRSSTS